MLWFRKKDIPRLPFATDMHAHLVPGIDDGSRSAENSVEMLGRMAEWGIQRVIPTPHVTEDTFENTPAVIDPAWTTLRDVVSEAGLHVDLLPPSAEYRVDSFFVKQLDAGNVRPLSGRYLLVENGYHQEPWDFENVIFDLRNRGYIPVLAHPERYLYYHTSPGAYRRLASLDMLLQCNILSLAGYYGKDVRRVAHRLVDEGQIAFLGSDMHAMRHIEAISDYMKTSDFRNTMAKLAPHLLNDTL